MKKILFLIRSLNVGGAERQLLTLVDALDRTSFNPVIVKFYSGGTLLPEFEKRGIRVETAGKSGRWDIFSFVSNLTKIIRAEKPDILCSYLVAANLLALIFRDFWKVPHVITSIRHSFLRKEDYDWTASFMYWVEDHLSFRADRVIINSFVGARQAEERGIPSSKIVVIPNGIDTDRFVPSVNLREETRRKLGYSSLDMVIGMVGRLDPVKDHSTFIKASAYLIDKNPHFRFLIVGDGSDDYSNRIRSEISRAGLDTVFQILPAERDPVPVYNALDICVSASVGEGFSNVIAEAMSCGVPCVVTDVGDSGMIVGETGRVIPAGDPEQMGRALTQLSEMTAGDRMSLGLKARQRIQSEFSVVKMVSATTFEFNRLG
ncbi:MAG: glycosyltransferase [Chloroflexi bacterium]|nr:glycosyltransferase [Chloroflexota bacterium]BCY16246.1 glycosyl transferase [Leptolinea sp. HRD-7]